MLSEADSPSTSSPEFHQFKLFQKDQPLVVLVKHAYKYYGTRRNPLIVLNGLDMTVPKGTIYGLLGASGCGKTTLLGCILGQKKLNSGDVWVLGGPPNTKGSGVPGPRVGYMPQESALYLDFTIYETFVYFGWLTGMDKNTIKRRFKLLTELLKLPHANQIVKTLSGGEQRRLTLASVLLNEPELLILDEPTVGIDPLLKESIWGYLKDISREGNTTIIMTTHYIEEARQAHIVGLMRGGKLLAEEEPEKLIIHHRSQTLEEVFLKLIFEQLDNNLSIDNNKSIGDATVSTNTGLVSQNNTSPLVGSKPENKRNCWPIFKSNHIKALIWKNALWWVRNYRTFIFSTVLAVFVIASFCICIGHEPRDLPVAVVNYEGNGTDECRSELTCNSTQLSCSYIDHLQEYSLILRYYNTEEDAINSVLHGETFASIIMRNNYSEALRTRIEQWKDTYPWDLEFSSIQITRDTSNQQIANFLRIYLYEGFRNFIHSYLRSCEINEHIFNVPVKMNIPIYGAKRPNFTDFVMPGALLTMVFLLAIILTANTIVIDRSEASSGRSFVLGITEIELLFSHFIVSFIIVLIQSLLAIFTTFVIFNTTREGSLLLATVLTICSGFCGMCYGLLISCICETSTAVNIVAIGTFFPIIMVSGVIWPIEGIHYLLQPISEILPLAKPTEGMRSILQRNWDLSTASVYSGFISTLVWSIIFLVFSIVMLKYKNK